jgi:leucyl aminopeptidase
LKDLYSSETILLEPGAPATRLLVLGAGKAEEYELQTARRLAGAAAKTFRKKGAKKIALVLPVGQLKPGDAAQAFAEGVMVSLPDSGLYKTGEVGDKPSGLEEVTLIFAANEEEARRGAEIGQIVGEGINLGRQLANEPGNVMFPARLAEEAQKVAEAYSLEFDALDQKRLEEGGFKAILAVGQGSEHEPRMIVLKYNGAGEGQPYLGLVGKGITFDTGGISIKPAAGMENLKYDMSGGAWVIAAMQIIAQLKPKINVVGVVAAAENMPGANAYRPGDVIGSLEGKTIEVANTDAEGRIVLADGLTYARKLGATRLVDLATLTGAARVALGSSIAAGVFGSDKAWTQLFMDTAEQAGERAWQLPLFPEYSQLIKSKIADIVNSVGGGGGASLGAAFIKEFSGGLPWIHLDIAPVSRIDEKPYIAKGSSGHLIRTLVDFVLANAEG